MCESVRIALSAVLLTVSLGTGAVVVHAAGSSSACTSVGTSGSVCRVIPASGSFRIPIPQTSAALVGTGSPDLFGKAIILQRTTPICKSVGGFGLRISTPRSTGLLPPLKWATGTLYAPDGRGTCHIVVSPALAAAPGVYQIAAGSPSGVAAMPASGGASQRVSTPEPPLVLLSALLAITAGLALQLIARRRRGLDRGLQDG